jgi:hypothetical protein
MGRYQVKAPNGHTYEYEAPDDATPQQLDAMAREVSGYAKNYPVTDEHPAPAAPAAPPPSLGRELLENTQNDVAGIVQGVVALPDMAATAAGKVMSAVPTVAGYGLDALGYGKAGNYMHGVARGLAHPYQIGDAVESVSPTPDTTSGKVNRFIGQMAGGAIGMPASAVENVVARFAGEVPKGFASTAVKAVAPSIVDDAKQAGVRVMTSDVKPPRTFIGKTAQAVGERIPITGTGLDRAAQQTERVNAVKAIAQDFGAASGDELASPAIDGVAKDLATRRGAELTRLTRQKDAVIDKLADPVPVNSATQAIDREIGKLESLKTSSYTPVIAKLNDWRKAIQGQSLRNIETLRKQIGEEFKTPDMASVRGVAEKALSNIYGPLREDMGSFIKATGDAGDFIKWKSANEALAGMVGDLKNAGLKKALRNADSTPEDVASLLFSQKPSSIRTLYAGLSPVGRGKAQAAILQKAVEKAGGLENISPDRFATQISSLGKSIGVFFQGNDLVRIEGLARVLKATQRAAQSGVAPATGVQAMPYVMGAGFTELFGVAGGLAAAGGTGLLARAYESPPVRNLLLKLGQSKAGSRQESLLIERTSAAIAAAAQNHGSTSSFLNDNISTITSAVASPGRADTNSEQQ